MSTAGTSDADVVVCGGGLAGAVAALQLVQRGLSVVVVDKAEFPRDKPCGEGLLPHGVDVLRSLGLADVLDAMHAPSFRGILYRCHGVVAPGDFEHGRQGRGVRRRVLDEALRARAGAAGATFLLGAVERAFVDDDGGGVVLRDGRTLRGRFLIGADGPRSITRHALGLDGGPPRAPRYALRQHFQLRKGAALPDRVEVTVAHGHELYVTPVAFDVVGVACLVEKHTLDGTTGKPEERLRAFIARTDAVADVVGDAVSDAMACGPLRVRCKDVGVGSALLVGDAAGYVDAITGEGMSLALRTSHAAVQAIVDVASGTATMDVARARYRRARAAIFRDHAILTWGLVELARHPYFARRAVARLAAEPALFSRLLAINDGTKSITSFSAADIVKLVVGKNPRRFLGAKTG